MRLVELFSKVGPNGSCVVVATVEIPDEYDAVVHNGRLYISRVGLGDDGKPSVRMFEADCYFISGRIFS